MLAIMRREEFKFENLTEDSAELDEVEDIVPGEPGAGGDVIAAGQVSLREAKIGRLLLGLAGCDLLQQLHGLLSQSVGVLK